MSKTRLITSIALALCGSSLAGAEVVRSEDPAQRPEPGILAGAALTEAPLLRSNDPGAERFLPVGKLLTGSGGYHCTATLIAGAVSPPPNQPALILTAGHCVNDDMRDNEVVIDQPAGSDWSYTPAYFIDIPSQHVPVAVTRTVYATMKAADLAVLQLNATYGQLAGRGIHPLRLERVPATPQASIELVHIPVVGVPAQEQFLRRSICRIQTQATPLVEGYYPWFWSAAVPNDCEGVAGGTSGSPVFQLGGSTVIGVLNTTVTPGYTGCGLGRPCEPTDTGDYSREGSSYYMQIDRIAQALRNDGTLDLAQLDPGNGVTLERAHPNWITQRNETIDGETRPARWNLRIGEDFDWIWYKTSTARSIDCANINGYQGPYPSTDQSLLSLQPPAAEGVYALCAIGQTSGGVRQPYEHATVVLRQIDETPPIIAPQIDEQSGGGAIRVAPLFSQHELVDLFIKYGPVTQTDCQNREGYQRYRRNQYVTVDKSQAWRFCAYGADYADNAGPPTTRDYMP